MTPEQLQANIDAIDAVFKETGAHQSANESLYARTIKLNEEVGELCEAILKEAGLEREKERDINIGSEIADVIITTFMIAKSKDIDVWQELAKKLPKVNERLAIDI